MAAGALVGTSVPAHAGSGAIATHLTRSEMQSALMRKSDVPRSVRFAGQKLQRETSFFPSSETLGPDLCISRNGDDIRGRKPVNSALAEIQLAASDLEGTISTASNTIYNYGTPRHAQAAWKQMRHVVKKRCVGTVPFNLSEDGTTASGTVTQKSRSTKKLFGARGFTLFSDVSLSVSGPIDISIIGDQFAAYRRVGSAVVRVEFARISLSDTKIGINKKRRAWTKAEVGRVAQRLAKF